MVPLLDGHTFPRVPGETPRVAFPVRTEVDELLLAAVCLGPRSPLDILSPPYRSWLGIAKEIGARLRRSNIELAVDAPK